MRKLTLAVLLLFAGALPAQALNTKDLLSLIAMPLAVAAVSDLSGVPQDQLADVVSTLNQADVPPAQFVDTVRYIPVALVAQPAANEPTFTQWLDSQSQSVTGPALVTTIDDRLATTYGVTPAAQPTEIVYVDDNYIPQEVVTRLQPLDPVAVAAMPLAVAAVSQLTGVPQDQLADLAAPLDPADGPRPPAARRARSSCSSRCSRRRRSQRSSTSCARRRSRASAVPRSSRASTASCRASAGRRDW